MKIDFENFHTTYPGAHSEFRLRGSNRDGVVSFQFKFLTGVVLKFLGGGVVFKTGVAFKQIRYVHLIFSMVL